MKRMLDPAIKGQVKMRRRASGSSGEIITHEQLNKLKKRARSHKWVPGTPSMTHEDHLDVIYILGGKCRWRQQMNGCPYGNDNVKN